MTNLDYLDETFKDRLIDDDTDKCMTNLDYLEAFKDHLIDEDKSIGTIDGYVSDIKGFLTFLEKDITEVSREEISAYRDYLRKRKLKTKTINRKLVALKQFIDFLNMRYKLAISARIKQEKFQRQYSLKDEEILTEGDFERLLAVILDAGDIRAKALLESMYYSGMRISEALQLRVDHVEKGLKVIEDIKGKGGKYRPIFISDKLLESLQQYLALRKKTFSSSSTTDALFVGERGRFSRQGADALIKKYAKAADIDLTKAHVHNLRHLFGLRLAAKGVPIQDIAKYMGHNSIDVTKIYTEKPQSYYADMIDQL